ncbi:DMT family transporter [Neptuniibacter sp. QD48_11]|uniref:DMT family transporter n=1 Tax=unclassified Neptuniibacter TaxID=2630693 RepID=UPI0039F57440
MNKDVQTLKVFIYTLIALIAFAGNSVLCRLALGDETIDAASFTSIRLLSGIVVLLAIFIFMNRGKANAAKGSWKGAFFLFAYAITFSYGYITLETGIGALVLFGSVQISIILINMLKGNKLHLMEWIGTIVAFAGFVYLIFPSLATPSAVGFGLMTMAGVAWGFYTLAGKGSNNPLGDTTYNFLRTLPFVLILVLLSFDDASLSTEGIWLAILSGGLASGIGYAIWYQALGSLSAIQAAVVQLLVPVIAAAGGVAFAGEEVTWRLVIASVVVLGGIMIVITGKQILERVKQ